jgi:Fe-S oxidoreductase/nitrate reductase gamma subunit
MEQITREIFWNVGGVRLIVYLLALIPVFLFIYGLWRKIKLWRVGKKENRYDQILRRIISKLYYGVLQVRNLEKPFPGIMHLLIFWGFVILFIGTVIIFLQEDLTLPIFNYEFLQGNFYLWYSLILDLFGVLAIIGVLLALYRRIFLRPESLENKSEDFISLYWFLLVLLTGFSNEGLRIAATNPDFERWSFAGWQIASGIKSLGMDLNSVLTLHRISWWIHLLLAFGFIGYISYSKLLHIISSPLNIFFRSFEPIGLIKPIPDLENQENFGVSKLEEFTWKDLLDTDACTKCGRCQDNCPAWVSSKPLSPKKVILDLKAHLLEKGNSMLQKKELNPDKNLIGEVILEDELWSCTTCGACMRVCPVLIEHIPKIVEMRRNLVLMQSKFPPELNLFFKNLENNYNPWTIGFATRADWAKDLKVKLFSQDKDIEYLYFVGCAGSFDERVKKVSKALVSIFNQANLNFGILGEEEFCCGDSARRIGNEYLAQILIQQNIETFKKYNIKKVIVSCPHGYNIFKNEYPLFGYKFEVIHHSELIYDLIQKGKLNLNKKPDQIVTYHDSCYLGRYNKIYESPRKILKSLCLNLKEMELSKHKGFCCGAGGGRMWMEEKLGKRINQIRIEQAQETGAKIVATACPFCLTMLEDGIKEKEIKDLQAQDLAELVDLSLQK